MADIMRTFRMVAEPGGENPLAGCVAADVVLRGARHDVDVVSPIVKVFLDVGCNLVGSWVDEGTERETVTFSVAPKAGGEPACSGCRVHCHESR